MEFCIYWQPRRWREEPAEVLTNPTVDQQTPDLITPDGTRLLFGFNGDIMVMPLDGSRRTTPLFPSPRSGISLVLSRNQRGLLITATIGPGWKCMCRSFSSPHPAVASVGEWRRASPGGAEGRRTFLRSTETCS